MKTTIIHVIILFSTMHLFAQSTQFKLPSEWGKAFIISVSHTGSMSGRRSRLTFTYDSCTYVTSSLDKKPKEKRFALSPTDRINILNKMNYLKVETIEASLRFAAQHDGWSNVLCFGDHCIEGGSASEMTEKDKGIFLTASRYLEEFAINR